MHAVLKGQLDRAALRLCGDTLKRRTSVNHTDSIRQFIQPFLALVLVCFGGLYSAPSVALEPATGKVLLTISGNIKNTNAGDEAHIDQAILDSLPVTRFKTATEWDDGVIEFEGVTVKHLLEHIGAGGAKFTALAIDGYEVEFMGVDVDTYPVLIAYKQDGKPLTVRTLGPLRIMFPYDDHPELHTQANLTLSVWQLINMRVH